MKKSKLFKTLLIPSLGIISLGSIATSVTSCGGSPTQEAKYLITGGELNLSGTEKKSGISNLDKRWVLERNGTPLFDNVSWSIVGNNADGKISISDGIISWTNELAVGNYKFQIKAVYVESSSSKKHEATSDSITLTISPLYSVSGGHTELFGKFGESGKDDSSWVLKEDGTQIQENVKWSIVNEVGEVENIGIDKDGLVIWNQQVMMGFNKFRVKATYTSPKTLENYEVVSNDIITLHISGNYSLTGGQLALSGEYGESGSADSDKKWVFNEGGDAPVPVTGNVTWSIVSKDGFSGISISDDGLVKWTADLSSRDYKFQVKGIYSVDSNKHMVISNVITLTIVDNYSLADGETELFGKYGESGSANPNKKWVLYKGYEPLTEADGVKWSLLGNDIDGISISDGLVKWTERTQAGVHYFTICGTYTDPTTSQKHEVVSEDTVSLTLDGEKFMVNGITGYSVLVFSPEDKSWADKNNPWTLTKDGKEVTGNIEWSIVADEGFSAPKGLVFSDSAPYYFKWSPVVAGYYQFYIRAKYNGVFYYSKSCYKLNIIINK